MADVGMIFIVAPKNRMQDHMIFSVFYLLHLNYDHVTCFGSYCMAAFIVNQE